MQREIVRFDPELATIEASKADQIRSTFLPMADMLSKFESAYAEIITESEAEITAELTAKAKRLRIDIGRVRIETEKLRKSEKEEYLRAGKAIDGVSNILKWAVTDKENKLKEIENHFETLEKARLSALQVKRVDELSHYVEDAAERDLAGMDEDVWQAYMSAKKKEHDDRLAAEKQAEADLIAKEKEAAEERKRIQAENERLKKEAVAKERKLKKEAAARAKADAEAQEKRDAERKAIEAKTKADADERERVAKVERQKREKEETARRAVEAEERKRLEVKLKNEADERAKLEAEKNAKAAEEEKSRKAAANKEHQKKINNAALKCFERNGFDTAVGKAIIALIVSDKIDHIKMIY